MMCLFSKLSLCPQVSGRDPKSGKVRRIGYAGTALQPRPLIIVKRKSAAGAAGRTREAKTLPKGETKAVAILDDCPAAVTAARQRILKSILMAGRSGKTVSCMGLLSISRPQGTSHGDEFPHTI
jgi:hypothetical protein